MQKLYKRERVQNKKTHFPYKKSNYLFHKLEMNPESRNPSSWDLVELSSKSKCKLPSKKRAAI